MKRNLQGKFKLTHTYILILFSENSSNEKIKRGFNREQESYSTFNPRSTLNHNNFRKNDSDDRLKINFKNNKQGLLNNRKKNVENNINYNVNKSNLSSSRTTKRLKQYNQDDNLYTIQTISNTNNNNTINIMDSLRISENSEEDIDYKNPFLAHDQDQSSNIHLNISGIAADLVIDKNEIISKQPKAGDNFQENNQYFPTNAEVYNRKMYKKKENNKYIQFVDDNLESNLFYDKNLPKAAKNNKVQYSYNLVDKENLEEKQPSNSNSNLKYFLNKLDNNSSNDSTPRSKKNHNYIINEKLKNIMNSISPIKNNEKVKFTEKEIEVLISKYLEQTVSKDNSNYINQIKKFTKNFKIKSAIDKNKLNNLIINEGKDGGNLVMEMNNIDKNNSRKENESENQSYKGEKYSNEFSTFNKQSSGFNNQENNYLKVFKTEKNQKLIDIFNKLPDVISEFKDIREKIKKNDSESEKPRVQFFNLNNLNKWIDLSNTNQSKNITNNHSIIDSNLTGKDILNEADNIINNHVLKMKKIRNQKEIQNNSDLQVENILKNVKEDSKKSNNLEADLTKIRSNNPSKESKEESKETLDKINYIYNILKTFSHTKLKDLITTQIKTKDAKEEMTNKLNESIQVKENVERLENKGILTNKNVVNEIKSKIRNDDLEIIFSDNKKISFELPVASLRIRQDEESNLYKECKENNENILSPNLLLSPSAKRVLVDNISTSNDVESNRDESVSKTKHDENLKKDYPNDIRDKKENQLVEYNIMINRPVITESLEKKDISFQPQMKSNLKKNDNIRSQILTAVDNGIKENQNQVNSYSINQDQADCEKDLINSVSKKFFFNDNLNENENEDSLNYQISKGNQDKEEFENEENNDFEDDKDEENRQEEEELNEENDNPENIYSEEEPRSLDNCRNILYISSNKKKDKHVKFEKILHSNSAKSIPSRNFKNKNHENLRSDFENGIEEYQQHNHSDIEIENEKINEEIEEELNKNVISDIPYPKKEKQTKVKFSEKLVFIEYEDESLAKDIKVIQSQKDFTLLLQWDQR